MSYPTVEGLSVEGVPYREARVCLTSAFASSYYLFFLSGTSTPANVYANGTLTTTLPGGNRVTADAYGRFPAIYLDPSIIYRVQLYNSTGALQWQRDPYYSQLSTVGTSSLSPYGFQIAATGEVTIDAPNTGGSGVTLTLDSGALGTAALQVDGTLAGNSAIAINNSATTGTHTATFTATNKPGTATSSPAGWLPITCDGVQYYTPIWHGNSFTPYASNPTAVGEAIVASSVTFGGNGLTTATGGTATPGNWFSPAAGGVGAGYYINITKTNGLSGVPFVETFPTNVTVAPSGAAYTGGTLAAAYSGNTASNYNVILSTGQLIAGCTFTNGSTTFTTPSTTITGTPNTVITVTPQGVWTNITSGGLTITSNAQSQISGTYQISSSPSGLPVVASGTITISNNNNGVQSPTYSGATPLVLAGNGTATINGASTSSWYAPTTANVGANYYILISKTGGTSGTNFTAATSSYTNITSSGLSIGVSGGTGSIYATGTYIIASDPAGVNQLGAGTVTIYGSDVQSPTWNGTTPLNLAGNGAATLNGTSTSSWYSPNTSNVGSGYYINITRTGGTSGVSFSAAQGAWTNITNSGLSIGLNGTSGNVGTVSAVGTYQISSNSSGTPLLGSGSVTLSLSGLTVLHVYTAAGSGTETAPAGSSQVTIELWGSGSGGGGNGDGGISGSGAGGPGYCRTNHTISAGQTLNYTISAVGAGGAGGGASPGSNGAAASANTVSSGTATITTMTANSGGVGLGGATPFVAGGAGGTATGGTQANTTGTAGQDGTSSGGVTFGGNSQGGQNYSYTSLGGNGGYGNNATPEPGAAGTIGAVAFYYQ